MNSSTLALHLKKAGYSLTKPRQAVFDLLAQEAPLTMHALWKKLSDSTNRASIYRTVALFESLGIVQRINRGWKYTLELTDQFIPHHHHLICTNCGKISNFDEPDQLGHMLSSVAEAHTFSMRAHTLEIEGLCSTCRDKN